MPQPPKPSPKSFTLTGVERANGRPQAHPRPPGTPHGEWLGDRRVFTDDLVDEKGNSVGHHSGHCTLVRIGPGDQRTYQCFATMHLPNGLLMGGTMFSFPLTGGIRAAILGGTGDFRDAAGQIEVSFPAPATTQFKVQLA
jgi:hypothetical protein